MSRAVAYFQIVGKGKRKNEDALFNGVDVKQVNYNKPQYVTLPEKQSTIHLAVADGLYSSRSSALASLFWMQLFKEKGEATAHFLRKNHTKFCDQFSAQQRGIACTFAGASIEQSGEFKLCNTGDSRIYHVDSEGKWRQISYDHTYLMELIEQGIISKENNYSSCYDDITEYISTDYEPFKIFVDTSKLNTNEYLILCTDGLSDNLTHAELELYWRQAGTLCEKLNHLMLAVKQQNTYDDCSVIAYQA